RSGDDIACPCPEAGGPLPRGWGRADEDDRRELVGVGAADATGPLVAVYAGDCRIEQDKVRHLAGEHLKRPSASFGGEDAPTPRAPELALKEALIMGVAADDEGCGLDRRFSHSAPVREVV